MEQSSIHIQGVSKLSMPEAAGVSCPLQCELPAASRVGADCRATGLIPVPTVLNQDMKIWPRSIWWCPAEFAGQGRSKEKNLWLSKRTEVKNILTSSGSEDCKHAHSFRNVWIHKSERAFGSAAFKAAVVSRWFLRTLEETQWWVQVLQVDRSYSVVKWYLFTSRSTVKTMQMDPIQIFESSL